MAVSKDFRQYLIVTGNYWIFTLTDGALRMLVVLYFYGLGYSPFDLAMLFVFYELFGVFTNLIGGWLGARVGLNRTMNLGLLVQIVGLSLLLLPQDSLSMMWVMAAQALSGVAKDLNKMSAKSSIKLLVPDHAQGRLFRWVAILTGSKNALKGVGFFMGGLLLASFGFRGAIFAMVISLVVTWLLSLVVLSHDFGAAKSKPKFKSLFSKSQSINLLSGARLFLFGARDVWFVVALPVYFVQELGWTGTAVGTFMAGWIIAYGVVQGFAPQMTRASSGARSAVYWASGLAVIPALIALSLHLQWSNQASVVLGLLLFGAVFAVNSSLHSYLIIRFARADGVSLDIGFYYMANAMGRLLGTVLSGWLFQAYGLILCLVVSSIMLLLAAFWSWGLVSAEAD